MAGDIEQVFRREGEPGERPAGAALDVDPRAGNKGAQFVVAHRDLESEGIAEVLPG
jgi:hypothetical protein